MEIEPTEVPEALATALATIAENIGLNLDSLSLNEIVEAVAELRKDKERLEALLQRADEIIERAEIIADGWPQACEWLNAYRGYSNEG